MDTKKKKLSLICVIAALLLIIGGVVGTLLVNGFSSSGDELSGEIQVSDEETLRQALRSKKDCVITVTEDIVVSRELVVNGDKRLLGASIIMNMQRVGSGESVLAVSKGAVLTLDGATVDGNGVVNCVSVKSGGRFESVSGSLVYGYPYGLDVSGVVDIVDIKIDEAMHTAINVAIFGDVNLRGGIISNNVYGIAVAEDAYMNIADGVSMTNSYASFIVNYGDMDIAGGKYDGAGDNAIENWGTLSVKGTAEKPVEICNGTKSALNSKNKSKLTAEHIKIYDMGWHGMCIEKNSTATLKNVHIDNAGKSSLYVNSSTANMEDVTVIGGAAYAVYGTKNANVTLKNVTIKDTNHRGIMNEDSTLEAEGLTIEGTAQHGVYAKGEAVTNINNATISKPGVSAVAVAGGEASITNTTVENTTKEGISVGVAGKVKIENVTITNPGNFGIANYGGTVEANTVQISNSGNASVKANASSTTTANGLVINNAGKQAISVEDNSVANIENCKIDTTKNAAVYVVNSTMTMKASTVNNAGSYAVAVKDCKKADGKKVTLDSIEINHPGEHGVGNINSYVLAGNIVVTGAKRCGIYTEGALSVTNMNQIKVYNAGTCGFGFNGGQEITARNVTIVNSKNEGIYAKAGANVKKLDNVVIQDAGTHGISVENATVKITVDTKYNPENTTGNGVTVINPKKNAVRCVGGTVSAVGVKIENAQGQGISVEKEGKMTVDGCTIHTTAKAAVYAHDSNLTLKNATINKAGTVAIAAKDCKKADGKKVQLSNITIDTTGEQAIANFNSYVLPQYITIRNSKLASVYTEGADSIYNMNQIEIIDAGTCGFGFNGAAEITARNVTITNPKNEGILVKGNANVKKLDNVTVTNPGTTGLDNQSGTVNITVDKTYNPDNTAGNGITIVNPGKYGINISKGATVKAAGATVTNAGDRGISSAGTLVLEQGGVTINGTKGHGIYLTADAVIKGSGLTVKAAGDNGIFSEGANLDITGLVLENTKNQGIQLKGGTVKISDFTIQGTGSAAVRPRLGTQLTLANGTIYSYNYGIATTDEGTVATVQSVVVERAAKDGAYKTSALVSVGSNSKVEVTDTILDGKYDATSHPYEGRGVVVEDKGTFILNSGTIQNNKSHASAEGGKGNGGGVLLKAGATFVMNGGTIQNNIAANGAGVTMFDGTNQVPVFTMNGGQITGNRALTNGGGLALSNGVFTLNEGAKITGNTAAKNGGGISMAGGTEAARPSFILNGGSFTGNTAAAGADMNCTGGSAKIKLGKKLTAPIHVKPNVYANTRLMAEKYGDISQADFESSMELLLVDSYNGENWIVLKTGYLGRQTVSVTTNGVTTMYLTLEEAVAAANASAGDDIITVLDNLTVAEQLQITGNVTITADKAVTITAAETAKGSMFDISSGTLAITGASEDAKITLAAAKVTTNIIYLNGGNVDLTNVHLAGNAGSTVGEKSGYGIYNNAGKVTAKSVTITDIVKGDGINIRAGASADLDNVKISNTGRYGIKNFGTVNIYNTIHADHALTVEGTKDHAVDIQGSGSVKSFLTNVPENTYPIQIKNVARMGMIVREGSSIDLSHISIEGTGEECVYFNASNSVAATGKLSNFKITATAKDAVYLAKKSDVTLTNGSITANTYVINVKNANASLTLDGCAVDGKTADVALAKGAAIKLLKALTAEISVKPSAYTAGVVVVENAGGLSAEDFAASVKLINVVSTDGETWFVDAEGKLAKAVASIGDTLYASLEGAIAAANAEDTVTLLADLSVATTVEVTKNVKIVSEKAVTISSATTVFKVAADTTLTVNGAASATITIASSNAEADVIHNEGALSLNYVNISGGKTAITAAAGTTLSNVTITDAGYRGIHSSGAVVINQNVIINGTVHHGIYLAASASLTGSGLTIQNAGNNGIFSEGAEINISGLTVENTAQQGIQSKGGNVTLSSFTFRENGSAAVRIRGGKVVLTNGTVYAYNYGIAADGGSETTVTDVTVERAAKGGAYTTNALVNIAGRAKLEIAGTTKIDGKSLAGDGVNVAASTATFTVSGGTFTGTAAGNADVALASGATIKLQKALTASVSVKPSACKADVVVVENVGGLPAEDFAASVKLINVVSTDGETWFVNGEGKLNKAVASIGDTLYASLEGAIAAANAEDTVTLLTDLSVATTVEVTKNVKIVSEKAVTVSSGTTVFKVAADATLTVNGTASATITIASSNAEADVIRNEGTAKLTYVNISGGKNAINSRENTTLNVTNVTIDQPAANGVNIAGGTTTLANVTITNAGSRGISSGGKLIVQNVSIEAAGDHGVYLGPTATISGTGLKIKNTVKRGIFSNGAASWTLSDVTVEDATLPGIYLNGGAVTLTNFAIKNGKNVGIYLNNSAKVTLNGGSFTGNAGADIQYANAGAKVLLQTVLTSAVKLQPSAYTVGAKVVENAGSLSAEDFAASVALLKPVDTNWFVDETGCLGCHHNWQGAVTTEPTCTGEGVKTYTCAICSGSYTEPVAAKGHSVAYVAAVEPSLEAEGNIAYWYCTVCNAAWKDEARTESITLQDVVLPKVEAGNVAYMNGTAYETLEKVVAAANETPEADTITLLCDATVNATISVTSDVTIKANKLVTITAGSSLTGDMVSVTGGTLKITGVNETNKITFAANNTTKRIIWNNGGSTELTNVTLSGEATEAGIRNESGSVIARNVVISGIAKDGIHTKSGTTTTVDNVHINNSGEDGIDIYGTLIISNSANPSHALTIDTTTKNHGIDVRKNAAVKTSFANVPAGTETLITVCNTKIGIIIRGGNTGSDLAYLHIHSTRAQGLHIGNDAVANVTVTNFKIEKTTGNALEVKKTGTQVTLTNGTISGNIVTESEIVYENVVK